MSESQAGLLYAFSILVIFLVLAALYESWTFPISVMLALPLGVIGGVLASSLRGMPNDVYFQIGLLTVLGLTTKNAILIVQFAKQHMEQGMGLVEATLEAAKLRLRPIVMTSHGLRLRRAAAGPRLRGRRRRPSPPAIIVKGQSATGTIVSNA